MAEPAEVMRQIEDLSLAIDKVSKLLTKAHESLATKEVSYEQARDELLLECVDTYTNQELREAFVRSRIPNARAGYVRAKRQVEAFRDRLKALTGALSGWQRLLRALEDELRAQEKL